MHTQTSGKLSCTSGYGRANTGEYKLAFRKYIRGTLGYIRSTFESAAWRPRSRSGKPCRYIRRYIRGTFGYIRVHSEYIRFLERVGRGGQPYENTVLSSNANLDAGTFAATASPFYNNKREGTERVQAKATHGHGGGGEGYRIVPPRVGVI